MSSTTNSTTNRSNLSQPRTSLQLMLKQLASRPGVHVCKVDLLVEHAIKAKDRIVAIGGFTIDLNCAALGQVDVVGTTGVRFRWQVVSPRRIVEDLDTAVGGCCDVANTVTVTAHHGLYHVRVEVEVVSVQQGAGIRTRAHGVVSEGNCWFAAAGR